MRCGKNEIHVYKNIKVINKSSFSKKELNRLIKLSLPKEINNKKVLLFVLNWATYRKEMKWMGLEKLIKTYKVSSFAGLSFYLKELVNTNWVSRPSVIVLARNKDVKSRFSGSKKEGYLPITTATKEELFISILSHELKHTVYKFKAREINQAAEETMCDRYSIRQIKAYRKKREK